MRLSSRQGRRVFPHDRFHSSFTLNLISNFIIENTELFKVMEFSNKYQPQVPPDSSQIVRTFTGSLDESFLLAAGTKEAQREIDAKTETRARRRKEGLYRDLANTSE